MTAPALRLSAVDKWYGRTRALEDASLVVRAGTLHALVGENGAGKSTLVAVAYGLVSPDGGTVEVRGRPATHRRPADAIHAGLGLVQQHFSNVGALTVAENVALGGQGRLRLGETTRRLRALGERTGLTIDPGATVERLSVAAQQRLEILKALSHDATILLLDEPAAVLAPEEAAELYRFLRTFAADGNAVVVVTHKLPEALSHADDITVLRNGRTVTSGAAADFTAASLTEAMIGDAPIAAAAQAPGAAGRRQAAPVLRAESLTLIDDRGTTVISDASFAIYPGELVGVAGVEGSGQHALMLALAGRYSVAQIRGGLDAPQRIGFIPEDRHGAALILDFDVAENLYLARAGSARGRVRWDAERDQAAVLMGEHDVRAASPRAPASALSGGNQQKLVLARELAGAPPLLVAENPTRGLDLRATAAVQERIRLARAAGTAVVYYSNDLDEILGLSDRVLVVHAGTVRELPPDRARVGAAMLGL